MLIVALMTTITTGRRVKAWRTHKGLTASGLAKRLGVVQGAVSNWECGRTEPTQSRLRAICDVLGISVVEFFAELPEC